jgi:hypothetical protein
MNNTPNDRGEETAPIIEEAAFDPPPAKASGKAAKGKSSKVAALAVVGGVGVLAVAFAGYKLMAPTSPQVPKSLTGARLNGVPADAGAPSATPPTDPSVVQRHQEMLSQLNSQNANRAAQSGGSAVPAPSPELGDMDPNTPSKLRPPPALVVPTGSAQVTSGGPQYQYGQQGYGQPGQPGGAPQQEFTQTPFGQLAVQRIQGLLQSREVSGHVTVDVLSTNSAGPGGSGMPNMASAAQPGNGISAAATLAPSSTAPQAYTLVSAGEIHAALLETAVDTDTSDTVLATLVIPGPLNGAKLVGAVRRQGTVAKIQFSLLSMPGSGISFPVNAFALDADTTATGVATEVDRKLFLKYGIKPMAAAIAAVGQAAMRAGTTIVSNAAGTTIVQDPLNASQLRNVAAGSLAGQISQDVNMLDTQPTVRVAKGTLMGIAFSQDAVYTPGAGRSAARAAPPGTGAAAAAAPASVSPAPASNPPTSQTDATSRMRGANPGGAAGAEVGPGVMIYPTTQIPSASGGALPGFGPAYR